LKYNKENNTIFLSRVGSSLDLAFY
jgi:hypothetical protein